jgi:hypothetical protein
MKKKYEIREKGTDLWGRKKYEVTELSNSDGDAMIVVIIGLLILVILTLSSGIIALPLYLLLKFIFMNNYNGNNIHKRKENIVYITISISVFICLIYYIYFFDFSEISNLILLSFFGSISYYILYKIFVWSDKSDHEKKVSKDLYLTFFYVSIILLSAILIGKLELLRPPAQLNSLPSQHQTETVIVIDSIPAIVDTLTHEVKRPIVNQEINEEFLSFTISKSRKRVVLSLADNKRLRYTAFKQDGVQEFQFPLDKANSSFQFIEEFQGAYSLVFQNSSASYRIYEEANKIGIIVKTGGKTYDLMGDLDTKEGSLQGLSELLLSNVIQ